MSLTLAIVGRPNVGKSTLFNRLVGRRLALVDDQPGVTRDLREGPAKLGDLRFTVIDTAGLEDATDDSLPARMRRLTERAVDMADVCLFMIDARAGVLPAAEVLADILRRRAKSVILAANKAEGQAADAGVIEAYALGLGDPVDVVLLGAGMFVGLAGHEGTGDAGIFENPDGSLILRFENFDIENGPDLEVYLVPGADQVDLAEGSIHLGELKGNIGDQNYELPAGTELPPGTYTALVWCEAFSVEFVGATIEI